MEDYKNRVEAVLFITGRFMTIGELKELTGIASVGILKDALAQLKQEYDSKSGALKIYEESGKFKLNIKKEYNYLTPKLLSSTEFDRPTQETLAIIAYKQPVLQSEIVKIRGNTAYDHIKTLKEAEFITSEKHGRTRILKLTPKFFDYFDIVESELKRMFNEVEDKVGYVEEIPEHESEIQKKIPEERNAQRENEAYGEQENIDDSAGLKEDQKESGEPDKMEIEETEEIESSER